ncbi:unnamed protein product [Cuscuta europaea]|uniref:C2H2-type domain-containing protein n=1 Tax=Cuscuta europaea TaxID=41803 RepID=A0A9P1E1U4_CUSEU|nr:unnamed protein product [Cuscuta europaea]
MERGSPSQKMDRREDDDDKNEKRPDFPAAGMKLRIGGPKLSPPSAAEEKKVHVCRSCNKIFSSGKALGGHMSSAHVQANRDYSYKKKQQLRLRGAAASDEEEEEWEEELASRQYFRGKDGKIVCILCDKKFPSRKSLFGHMRCHPERCWRGMEPPHPPPQQPPLIQYNHHRHPNINLENHHQTTTSTSSGSPAAVNLQTLLWSWSVKGQRGRSPNPSAFSSSSSDEVNPVNRLVNADSQYPHPSFKNPNPEIPSKNIKNGRFNFQSQGKGKAIWEPRFRSQEKSSSSEFNFDQIHDEDDDVSKNFSSEDDEEALGLALVSLKNLGSPFPAKNCSNNSNKKRRICEKGSMDFEIGSGEDSNKFKCSTCSKSFTTHQALGGHRSSHNKFKVTIQNAIDDPQSVVPGVNNDNNDDENGENVDVAGILANNYPCGVCKKNFPTRRALGGHKKCHSAAHEFSLGQQQQEVVMAAAASSSPERSSTTPVIVVEDRPKVLAFDLNEVPDIMDDLI